MSNQKLETLRHSASHVMAEAVKSLWPDVKLGIGPAIEDGFYYDFDMKHVLTPEDLAKIEKKMTEIIKADLPLVREELSKKEAIKLFKKLKETYKLELIEALPQETVSIYKTGDKFLDLCKGPHVKSTSEIKAFKLLSIAGAYWHGIETNPMLQRIYGTAFESKKEMDEYLKNVDEAKKRDHRKLGKELRLFNIFHDDAGAGLVLYYPKGATLRTIIEDYLKTEHRKRGYQLVITPHMLKQDLWQKSGHYDYYKDNMFIFKVEKKEYAVKPMNCPGHMLIYKSQTRSYRDLPLRLFELGTVYRYEKSGVLHGLLRVRGFTQDDAHIFCTEAQAVDEIDGVIDFVTHTMKVFGFDKFSVELSTRPQKSIGTDQQWASAENSLKQALEKKGLSYDINVGEGAFYGPKIDIKLKDALNREWQCATIQCDFSLPEKFDLTYVDADGKEKRPVMIHRVIVGSLERFMGALLEHYGGDLPVWLSPIQAVILPIKSEHQEAAAKLKQRLTEEGFRVELDTKTATLNKRIREAELEKIPYILVLGDREIQQGTASVRRRRLGDQGDLKIEPLIEKIKAEVLKYH